jgi:hypothetical protein
MLLDVYYYDANGARRACPSMTGVNITTSQSQYLALGNAPVPLVNQQTQIIADSVNTAMMQVFNLMQTMILQTTTSQLTLMVYSGLPAPNATAFFEQFAADQKLFAQRMAAIVANNTILSAFDMSSLTNASAASAAIGAQNDKLNETLGILGQQVATDIALAAIESATAKQMNASLANLEIARAAYIDAEVKWTNALVNWANTSLQAFADLRAQPDSGFGALFGGLMISALAEVCGLGGEIVDGIVSVADDVERLGEKVWDGFVELVKKAIDTLGGFISAFLTSILIIAACVCGGGSAAYILYKVVQERSDGYKHLSQTTSTH